MYCSEKRTGNKYQHVSLIPFFSQSIRTRSFWIIMRVLPHYLVSAGFMARALSQTPPGTQPATNNTLAVSYGTTKVTPGIELPLTRKFLLSLLYSTTILTSIRNSQDLSNHKLPLFRKPNISAANPRPFNLHRYPEHLNPCPWHPSPPDCRYIPRPHNPPSLLADRSRLLPQRYSHEHYNPNRLLPAASAATRRYSPHLRLLPFRAGRRFRSTTTGQPFQRGACEQG